MPAEINTKGIPHKKLAPILDKLKKRVFNHDVVKDIFKKYKLNKDEIDLIPVCFAKIPVSARTNHGIIYLNIDLASDISDNDHYLAHEVTHFAQQTTGSKPTQGSDADDYLDNPVEQEGFRNQTKYISDTQGDEVAEEYIDQVMDYHDVDTDDKKRDKLLELASVFHFNILLT
jgi:hypothetical protein